MADTAFQTQYRDEFIAGFEPRQSLVRSSVTTEGEVKGNQIVFLVADSGGASATTRGVNGLIPARADNLTQVTATLVEWNDLVRRTSFNLYASQGDGRRIMQETTMGVLNRKVDQDIITQLNTGTLNTGTAQTASLSLAMRAQVILGNNKVPGSNLFGLITPAFEAYLMQTKEFASADYVNSKPFEGEGLTAFRWAGVTWIVHPELPGAGTSAEKCFVYHKTAIGHGCDMEAIQTAAGYDEEQNYSFARATAFMGSKVLQNSGIVVVNHDGSAYAAA